MPTKPKLNNDDLQALIADRIEQAKERQIFQKAFAVVQAMGEHTRSTYSDSGEIFYDDKWCFSQGNLSICGYRQYCNKGEVDITIIQGSKTVFSGEGKVNHHSGYYDVFADNPDEVVRGYIPDQSWEEWLNRLAKPMIDKHNKLIAQERRKLRCSFGL